MRLLSCGYYSVCMFMYRQPGWLCTVWWPLPSVFFLVVKEIDFREKEAWPDTDNALIEKNIKVILRFKVPRLMIPYFMFQSLHPSILNTCSMYLRYCSTEMLSLTTCMYLSTVQFFLLCPWSLKWYT